MRSPTSRRVLALLPHPDDCEILCAGTLLRLQEEAGFEIHVATMTAGDMGSPNLPREQIAAIRREEARRGAAMLGAASYTCLEFEDVEIVFDRDARHRVAAMLRKIDPAIVFTTPPNDYMFDHVITSQLVRDACFNAPMNNYTTPGDEKPTSGIPYLFYTDALEGHDIFGVPSPTTCLVDISLQIERKAAVLACHASQREWLRTHHGMDEYIETMKSWCARRGEQIGVAYAEAFCQHLGHPHTADNPLITLLNA